MADPADDLAWLVVAAPADAVDSILEAYQLRRTELTDPHLLDRAMLAGELALARWLLHGVRTGDPDVVVDDAVGMLRGARRADPAAPAPEAAAPDAGAPPDAGPAPGDRRLGEQRLDLGLVEQAPGVTVTPAPT